MSLRLALLILLSAGAVSARAQGLDPATQLQLDDLRARQQAAERQAIDAANQAMAAEARLKAEQAVLDLQLQRALPLQPPPSPYPPADGQPSRIGDFPSVPDAVLADSNRRVQAAARHR